MQWRGTPRVRASRTGSPTLMVPPACDTQPTQADHVPNPAGTQSGGRWDDVDEAIRGEIVIAGERLE